MNCHVNRCELYHRHIEETISMKKTYELFLILTIFFTLKNNHLFLAVNCYDKIRNEKKTE